MDREVTRVYSQLGGAVTVADVEQCAVLQGRFRGDTSCGRNVPRSWPLPDDSFVGFLRSYAQLAHHRAPVRERRLDEVQCHEAREPEPLRIDVVAETETRQNEAPRN